MTILLASTSPRRYHILSLLRLPFLMIPPASAEITSDARLPEREVLYQAEKKAASLAAADTALAPIPSVRAVPGFLVAIALSCTVTVERCSVAPS